MSWKVKDLTQKAPHTAHLHVREPRKNLTLLMIRDELKDVDTVAS